MLIHGKKEMGLFFFLLHTRISIIIYQRYLIKSAF